MSSSVDVPAPVLRDLRYLGGHPSAPLPLEGVDISFDADGVKFERRREALGTIAWERVRELTADAELTTEHVTVPRIFFLGVLAALFRRRRTSVLLRLTDERGAWLFKVEGISLDELRRGLGEIRQRFAH